MARITTHEAAERLGIPEQTIRILMQRGLLPIGICTKLSEGSERYTYIIISEQLEKWQKNGSLIGNTEENAKNSIIPQRCILKNPDSINCIKQSSFLSDKRKRWKIIKKEGNYRLTDFRDINQLQCQS